MNTQRVANLNRKERLHVNNKATMDYTQKDKIERKLSQLLDKIEKADILEFEQLQSEYLAVKRMLLK